MQAFPRSQALKQPPIRAALPLVEVSFMRTLPRRLAHELTRPRREAGQSVDQATGPGANYSWDMNACHTFYTTAYGFGNVPRIINGNSTLAGSETWEGDNPPPAYSGFNCGLFWCPDPPHPDPNFYG